MMSMTCQNVDFGRMRFACSNCSSNALYDRGFVKNGKGSGKRSIRKGHGARKLFCFRSNSAKPMVYGTKTPESLVNGMKI